MARPEELQVIRCKCGVIFAACVAPECYTDVDWMRDVRKYASRGYKVETIKMPEKLFEKCTCVKGKTDQLVIELSLSNP